MNPSKRQMKRQTSRNEKKTHENRRTKTEKWGQLRTNCGTDQTLLSKVDRCNFTRFHCTASGMSLRLSISVVIPQSGERWPAVMALIGRSVLARPPPIRIQIVPRRQIAFYLLVQLINILDISFCFLFNSIQKLSL